MFTGIVEAVGVVTGLTPTASGQRLTVQAPLAEHLAQGESIAVDGACLTVVATGAGRFAADVSPTTLGCTTLGTLRPGTRVNLERALRVGDRLSGHWVTGHVDEVGQVLAAAGTGDVRYLDVAVAQASHPLLVPRGSVALAGISLTIVALTPRGFEVTVIPHTLESTTLEGIDAGRSVNVEYDLLGKYVRQQLQEMKGA